MVDEKVCHCNASTLPHQHTGNGIENVDPSKQGPAQRDPAYRDPGFAPQQPGTTRRIA